MAIGKFLKRVTTGSDNEKHDIVRVSMTVMAATMPFVLIWGIAMQTWVTTHPIPAGAQTFSMKDDFMAVVEFLTSYAAFLMGGAASLFFKKSTEPDGTVTEVDSITKGQQPDVTTVTNVIQPASQTTNTTSAS